MLQDTELTSNAVYLYTTLRGALKEIGQVAAADAVFGKEQDG